MLKILDKAGRLTVSEMSEEMKRPLSAVSENMRALNARGLLAVKRHGREVHYRIGTDPSVPGAKELLRAVMATLKSHREGSAHAFRALTGLTHYRRHRIMYELHREPLAFGELRRRTGISRQALQRHLRKLRSRGLITQQKGKYRLAKPKESLCRCLLALSSRRP